MNTPVTTYSETIMEHDLIATKRVLCKSHSLDVKVCCEQVYLLLDFCSVKYQNILPYYRGTMATSNFTPKNFNNRNTVTTVHSRIQTCHMIWNEHLPLKKSTDCVDYVLFGKKWRTEVLFVRPLVPCFGILVMFVLHIKARVDLMVVYSHCLYAIDS